MAEPYKSTPASRVFGMGLPRRSNLPPATFFGTPIAEERQFLNPSLRKNALAEQEFIMREQSLADKQAEMDRQRRIMEAEDAAIADLEAGADLGNIFQNRPGLALSKNFNQFSQMAQMEPSKASKTLANSFAQRLQPQSRSKFFNLLSGDYANDPLGALSVMQMEEQANEQKGKLRNMGIDPSNFDWSKGPLSNEELADVEFKANRQAKIEQARLKKMEEQDLYDRQATEYALKNGVPMETLQALPDASSKYQIAALYKAKGRGASGGSIGKQYSQRIATLKDLAEQSQREYENFDENRGDTPEELEALKKLEERKNNDIAAWRDASSQYLSILEEGEPAGGQVPSLLPYAPYSPEYRARFQAASGAPAVEFTIPSVSGAATRRDVAKAQSVEQIQPKAQEQKTFQEKMKEMGGQEQNQPIIKQLTPKEELEQINQVKDSPEALMTWIKSENTSESSKKEALKNLEAFSKKLPSFAFSEGTPEQIANLKASIPAMLEEAKQIVELEPFRREVNKAWTTEKKNIESLIKDFAKAIGVTPSLAEKWLNKNVDYTVDFDPLSDAPSRTISIREYFDEYLQNRVGKSLYDKADILTQLSKKKHAKKAGLDRWFGLKNEEVLDSYLGEKFPASEGMDQNQVAQPAPTLNIKNVRVKPPEQP